MPIYEYQCDSCETIKEEIHKIDEEVEIVCTVCTNPMHKVISASGFILKGAGFYQNDYGKGEK